MKNKNKTNLVPSLANPSAMGSRSGDGGNLCSRLRTCVVLGSQSTAPALSTQHHSKAESPGAGSQGKECAPYLLVQGVPGACGSRAGPGWCGRPLAAATFQEVHASRAAALLTLEVKEYILVESEPLLVPAARLGCLLAQETALGALLARQEGQVQGVPLVVAHAFLHGEGAGWGVGGRSLSPAAGPSRSALLEDAPRPVCHRAPRPPTRPIAPIRAGAPSPPRPRPLGHPTPPDLRKPGTARPSEGARTHAAPPEVAGAEPPAAGCTVRRAAAGGLSSGNALRETEGKTSRGRSAVIGLETDLKGKVGAVAAAEALPALPSAHPSLACQDPGLCLCPGQPPMGQIAREGQECRGTQPLTAETRTNMMLSHTHRQTHTE